MTPNFINESALWGPLFALGVFTFLILMAAVVQVVFQMMIRHRMHRAPDALDTQILTTVRGPIVLFVVMQGLFLSVIILSGLNNPQYEIPSVMNEWTRKAWVVVIIAEVSYLATHISQILLAWYVKTLGSRTGTDLDTKLLPPVKRILPIAIYAVGTLIALDSLDIPISPLLAGFGIGGLAIALAVQPTLSNFFSGTYLVTEGELQEGDFIELEGGPSGFVVDVGWRSTKIRSRFNNLVIIPNSKMSDSIVTNYYSPTPAMNVTVECGVSYDSDLAVVEKAVLEVAEEVISTSEDAVKDVKPFFGFSVFGDSNINFWVFVQANSRLGSFILKSEIIKRIHARFGELGIEINYPVRKLIHPTSDGDS